MTLEVLASILFGFCFLYFTAAGEGFAVKIDTKRSSDSSDSDGQTAFVATNEWQEIRPGQAIPRGLHVRIDMTSGKKEAKLMDPEDDTKTASLKIVPGAETIPTSEQKHGLTHEELAEALSKIKSDGKEDPKEKGNEDEIRRKFRSYEQLKKDLGSVKIKLQTDYEVLDGLVNEYESLKGQDTKENAVRLASVLEELEFHVHKFDTARDFADDGGFTKIVQPALNSSYEDVRAAAAFLTGSALSSNPKVQIAALEAGLVESLLRVVRLDSSGTVRKRALYALSSLVRQFPLAQKRLLAAGGIDVFASVFMNDREEDRQMQLKIVTLLHDLVLEHRDAVEHMNSSNDLHREKVRQYDAVNLAVAAKRGGFCSFIPQLLIWPERDTRDRRQDLSSAISDAIPIRPEHDIVEKVLDAMRTFSLVCKEEFRKSSLATCRALRDSYADLANKESASAHPAESSGEGHQYYSQLAATAASVCDLLSSNSSEVKEEL